MQRTLLLVVFCVLSSLAVCQKAETGVAAGEQHVEYICRMYCTDEVSLTPARCRVCGMEMEDRKVVENPRDYKVVSPEAALEMIRKDKNILLLDVRSREEYNDKLGHLENSVLIPVGELEDRVGELAHDKHKTVIAYCSHGIRSAQAAKFLSKKGFSVLSLMGGLTKWNRERLPVVRE